MVNSKSFSTLMLKSKSLNPTIIVLVCAVCVHASLKKQDLCSEKREVVQVYYGLSSFFVYSEKIRYI